MQKNDTFITQESTECKLSRLLESSESESCSESYESTEAKFNRLINDNEAEEQENENESGKVLFRDNKNDTFKEHALYDEAIISKDIRNKATHEADQKLYNDVSVKFQ